MQLKLSLLIALASVANVVHGGAPACTAERCGESCADESGAVALCQPDGQCVTNIQAPCCPPENNRCTVASDCECLAPPDNACEGSYRCDAGGCLWSCNTPNEQCTCGTKCTDSGVSGYCQVDGSCADNIRPPNCGDDDPRKEERYCLSECIGTTVDWRSFTSVSPACVGQIKALCQEYDAVPECRECLGDFSDKCYEAVKAGLSGEFECPTEVGSAWGVGPSLAILGAGASFLFSA
jgi:hypothetical protein